MGYDSKGLATIRSRMSPPRGKMPPMSTAHNLFVFDLSALIHILMSIPVGKPEPEAPYGSGAPMLGYIETLVKRIHADGNISCFYFGMDKVVEVPPPREYFLVTFRRPEQQKARERKGVKPIRAHEKVFITREGMSHPLQSIFAYRKNVLYDFIREAVISICITINVAVIFRTNQGEYTYKYSSHSMPPEQALEYYRAILPKDEDNECEMDDEIPRVADAFTKAFPGSVVVAYANDGDNEIITACRNSPVYITNTLRTDSTRKDKHGKTIAAKVYNVIRPSSAREDIYGDYINYALTVLFWQVYVGTDTIGFDDRSRAPRDIGMAGVIAFLDEQGYAMKRINDDSPLHGPGGVFRSMFHYDAEKKTVTLNMIRFLHNANLILVHSKNKTARLSEAKVKKQIEREKRETALYEEAMKAGEKCKKPTKAKGFHVSARTAEIRDVFQPAYTAIKFMKLGGAGDYLDCTQFGYMRNDEGKVYIDTKCDSVLFSTNRPYLGDYEKYENLADMQGHAMFLPEGKKHAYCSVLKVPSITFNLNPLPCTHTYHHSKPEDLAKLSFKRIDLSE